MSSNYYSNNNNYNGHYNSGYNNNNNNNNNSNNMYNIIVQNTSGRRGNYVFCCAPPECSGVEAQTTAWISADVPQNGTHCVSTTDQVFAWTGTCSDARSDSRSDARQESLRPGSLVRNGFVAPVQLGNDYHRGTTAHMTVERGLPVFGHSTLDARNGAFEIECDNSVRGHEDILIGVAKLGAHGIVAPTAVLQAMPSQVISLRPRMRFYISEQECQVGEIIDIQRTSSYACVDFNNSRGRDNTAVITHRENGEYTIQYCDQEESREVLQAVYDGQLRSHLQRRQNNNGNNNDHHNNHNNNNNNNNRLRNNGNGNNNNNNNNNNDDQLRELTQLTATLTRLISGMNLNAPESEAASMRWIGRVNWPTAITINTASQGAGLIAQHLTTRGYRADFRTLTNADGTKTAEFTVSRNSLALLAADPEADWLAALKADTQSDGHTNGGFNPAPGLDRAALSKAQKRQSLLQMRGVLDQFQNGQRGEYNDRNGAYQYHHNNQNERHLNGQSNGNFNGHLELSERSNGVY